MSEREEKAMVRAQLNILWKEVTWEHEMRIRKLERASGLPTGQPAKRVNPSRKKS